MGPCENCGQALACPLVCEACGTLQNAGDGLDPFEVFGLEPRFDLDTEVLRKRLLKLSRRMHPDFFGADEDQRQLAERNSAELNAAHARLADDYARANLLLNRAGGPDVETERQMPQDFLMEVMEWNEVLEEARESPDDATAGRVAALGEELTDARSQAMSAAGTLLDSQGDTGEVRRQLNAVRYVDRALEQIEELRLGGR